MAFTISVSDTMTTRPVLGLPVAALDAGLAFYLHRLQLRLATYTPDADIAELIDPDGDQLLLAGLPIYTRALEARHSPHRRRHVERVATYRSCDSSCVGASGGNSRCA